MAVRGLVLAARLPAVVATTEDFENGIYQIETVLGPIGTVDPASDRVSWAILMIAFAGMTATASMPRRARRPMISI